MKKKIVHGFVTAGKSPLGMVLSVLTLFFSLLPLAAVAGDTVHMTFSGFMLPSHVQSRFEAAWCEEVENRTDSKKTYYPGQTLSRVEQNYGVEQYELLNGGGAICGTVYESDEITPVANGWVSAFTRDPCSPEYAGYGQINADGSYVIEGLSAGSYYLQSHGEGNYLDEYWADPGVS